MTSHRAVEQCVLCTMYGKYLRNILYYVNYYPLLNSFVSSWWRVYIPMQKVGCSNDSRNQFQFIFIIYWDISNSQSPASSDFKAIKFREPSLTFTRYISLQKSETWISFMTRWARDVNVMVRGVACLEMKCTQNTTRGRN